MSNTHDMTTYEKLLSTGLFERCKNESALLLKDDKHFLIWIYDNHAYWKGRPDLEQHIFYETLSFEDVFNKLNADARKNVIYFLDVFQNCDWLNNERIIYQVYDQKRYRRS